MNPIEKVMTKRSTSFKVALAVVALLLVLWATGSSIGSIWLIPAIVLSCGLRYSCRCGSGTATGASRNNACDLRFQKEFWIFATTSTNPS